MKCTHCGRESKYRERKDAGPGARCAGCGKQFAFEPQRKDPFTDAAFKAAIESVSASGQVRWGVEHLYYELCRRLGRRALPWSRCVVLFFVSAIPLAFLGLWLLIPILLPLWIGFWILLRRYGRSDTVPMDQADFDRLWNRWVSVHGQPDGVIIRKTRPGAPRSREPDIGDYSFDRAVICDRARTVDLLIANNFHFENNCAVLSVGGYPEGPFEIVRAMLKRNPKLEVFALHDASVAGCQLARLLVNDAKWFKDQVPVTDVGLRPGHAEPFKGLFLPAHVALALSSGDGISATEATWLSRYVLELAAIRPEQILKRLFRAINRREDSDDASTGGGGFADGGVYNDGSSFSSDAGDSSGGADSFG